MWLLREPCRVAHGKNEGEASWRDIEELKVMNNFYTISAMLDCRKLHKLHQLKFLKMSFFLLVSLFSCNFQPALGEKRCSYANTLQKISWKDGGCDSEMNSHVWEASARGVRAAFNTSGGTFWVNPRPAKSRQIADGKLLCYSSHTGPQKAVNSQPYIKMINFTQMSTT